MSRLQRVVLTVAAIVIAAHSCVPPWAEYRRLGTVTVERPLGSYLLFDPPRPTPLPTSSMDLSRYTSVRVDYGRLGLYYLGTLALVVPFFAHRRRSGAEAPGDE